MRVIKKLRAFRGETLVETLVAILICVLSLTMMLTATTVAARLNGQATEGDRRYTAEFAAADLRETAGETGTVTVRSGGGTRDIPAQFYGSDGSPYRSYAVPEGGG